MTLTCSEIHSSAQHALRTPHWTAQLSSDITALSIAPDGLIAIGTGAGIVALLDADSGAVLRSVLAHAGGVTSLGWSSGGHALASAGHDGRACLYDARGNELAVLSRPNEPMEHVAWSPGGEWLATASGPVARIWSATGQLAWTTDAHEGAITGLAWNPRGSELATICFGGVQLFGIAPEPSTRRLPWRGSLISLAWSPTGAVLACGTQQSSVRFWRTTNGQNSEMLGFKAKPRALAWSSTGGLLATAGDKTVSVWIFDDAGPEGRSPIQLVGHDALCTALAFHPRSDCLASGADDMRVLLWAPGTSTSAIAQARLNETVTTLGFTTDGARLIAADAAGTVRSWVV